MSGWMEKDGVLSSFHFNVFSNSLRIRRDLALRLASTKCADRADASPMRGLPVSGEPSNLQGGDGNGCSRPLSPYASPNRKGDTDQAAPLLFAMRGDEIY